MKKIFFHVFLCGLAVSFTLFGCKSSPSIPAPEGPSYDYLDSVVQSCHDLDSLKNMVHLFHDTRNYQGEMKALRSIGKYYRDHSDFIKAIEYHRRAMKLLPTTNDTLEGVRTLNDLATDYRRVGALDLASDFLYRALEMNHKYSDKKSYAARKNQVNSQNGLGNVMMTLGELQEADSIFRLALSGEQELKSDLGQAINLANIGSVFEQTGKADSARYYYELSLRYNEDAKSTLGVALCYQHLGELDEKEGDMHDAIESYERSYDLLKDQGDTWHLLDPCIALAKAYFKQRDMDKMQKYVTEATEGAKSINSYEHLAKIYQLRHEIAHYSGNSQEALFYYKESDRYRDSIINQNSIKEVQQMRLKLEKMNKEEDLLRMEAYLKSEHESKVNAYIALAAMSLLFFFICGFAWYVHRTRQKSINLLTEVQNIREHFFTNITHEFRTPLTIILGLAQQLRQGEVTEQEEVANLGNRIHLQGRSLLTLINQLLDVAKVKSAVGNQEWGRGNIVTFINMLVEIFAPYVKEHQIELHFQPDNNHVEMDFIPDYIDKIVHNLLSNAVKFTPALGHITLRTSNDDNLFYLEVSDTGIGMPPEVVPHVFEPFYQGDTDSQNIGTGIGLSLVYQTVLAMNGNISVKSAPDKGSSFYIQLPLRQIHVKTEAFNEKDYLVKNLPVIEKSQTLVDSENTDDHQGIRILIVEDNTEVAYYIGSYLDSLYDVFYAKDGKEGLAKAEALVPDLIIADLMMPEMNGFEMIENLRKSEPINHIPVIIVTARESEKDKIKGIEVGADAYLVKPFSSAVLLVRVKKLLEQHARLREKYSHGRPTDKEIIDEMKPAERNFINKVNEKVFALIRQRQLNAEMLASEMCMSRVQLNRKMLAITGQNTSDYVTSLRIDHAKHLLDNDTDMPIGEVGIKCGYEDIAYFSRVFKQITGMTPSQYRKRK